MVKDDLTPKKLLKAYTSIGGNDKAVIHVATMVVEDLSERFKLATQEGKEKLNDRQIWQIVEDQRGIFLSFCILAKEFYGQELVNNESYETILELYAPEIFLVWKWQNKK